MKRDGKRKSTFYMFDARPTGFVFFYQPNYDAVVQCLPSCMGPGNPAKYAPVTSGEHRLTKFLKGVGADPAPRTRQ